jgi:hypothetical protein
MVTSDQALFLQLNFGNFNCRWYSHSISSTIINLVYQPAKDEPLRRSLGCSPDEVQAESGNALEKNQSIARLRIRKFQKRLLIAEDVGVEFVAVGMWSMSFGFFLAPKMTLSHAGSRI